MKNSKTEPWRLAVGFIAAAFIVFMWVKKDLGAVYATMPQEQLVPMIVTSVVVTAIKVAAVLGGFSLIKWLVKKLTKK